MPVKNKVHIGFRASISVLFIIALVGGIKQILEIPLQDVEECANNTDINSLWLNLHGLS